MKWIEPVLVLAVVACAREPEPSSQGEAGKVGQSGGGSTAGSGSGGASTPASGGSGGSAPSGGRGAASGGTSPAGAGGGTAGINTSGAAGGHVEGGATTGGESGAPASGSGGASAESGSGGSAGGGGEPVSAEGRPCDIYASGNTPCAAAYSTVRALFEAYDGPLYQVRRADGELQDIALLPSGFADAATQDDFCGEEACSIAVVYDQSGNENHLSKAPPDCYQNASPREGSNESDAKARSLELGGHDVYALQMVAYDGYRANLTTGMPTGGEEQGIYEVVDGSRVGTACCWDFGNGSTDNCPGPEGTANALFFGTAYWGRGAGDGPWFMADFENGVWAGGDGESSAQNPDLPSVRSKYAFGVLKTGAASYTLRVGDAQSGGLTTAYDGAAPRAFQMQGAVILGLSSDASNGSHGTFFEGAITKGRPSDAVDDAVLRNVQAAGYGE